MSTESPLSAAKPWWRESEILLLIAVALVAYFLRAGQVPFQGEESTRALIAYEMVERGDYLVPRVQGQPFLIRPPLQNWLIAGTCLAVGSWDVWATRWPSAIATLLTMLLLYGYCRTFLPRLGALATALAFATLGHVLQKGREAETEALFVFCFSAALLTWHWGLMRGWPDALSYAAGYSFMVGALMSKGLQAPAYFLPAIGGYLLLTGQWRRLFSRGHLIGALAGAALLLAWLIPYGWVMGWDNVTTLWLGDPAWRTNGGIGSWELGAVAGHLLLYPLQIIGSTMPWSLLLLPYVSKSFRASLGAARPQVLFAAICMAVAFPTCWLPPSCLPRYFAPLYPSMAVLIGVVVQRCAEAEIGAPLFAAWQRYVLGMAVILFVAAGGILGVALAGPSVAKLAPFAEPILWALAYAAAFAGLAAVLLRIRQQTGTAAVRTVTLVLAAGMILTFTGVLGDIRLQRCEKPVEAIAAVKRKLPADQPLVSLGRVDCMFVYYFGKPMVTQHRWPRTAAEAADLEYFCFQYDTVRPQLPFEWEEIGTVPLDRNHHPVPEEVLVVGRRVEPTAVVDDGE